MRSRLSGDKKTYLLFRHSWMVPVSIAIMLAASSQIAFSAGDKVTLKLVVTDCYGTGSLQSSIQVIPTTFGSTRYLQYPKTDHLEVSPGSYSVVASATNFRTSAGLIVASNRDVLVSMCLDVSPIEKMENEQPPSLIGKVDRELASEQPMWVRLVGLYFEFNATESVEKESLTENGVFRFVGIRPARYMLILYGMKGIKISREVDVPVFGTYVTIGEKEITAPPR